VKLSCGCEVEEINGKQFIVEYCDDHEIQGRDFIPINKLKLKPV
jgi:hypothetical protein